MRYFTFKENDKELAIVDLSGLSWAEMNIPDSTIEIGLYQATDQFIKFSNDTILSKEFLRLTTAIQSYDDSSTVIIPIELDD